MREGSLLPGDKSERKKEKLTAKKEDKSHAGATRRESFTGRRENR